MSRLYSIIDFAASSLSSAVVFPIVMLVVVVIGVVALVISIGNWKVGMGILRNFKSANTARRHERGIVCDSGDVPC